MNERLNKWMAGQIESMKEKSMDGWLVDELPDEWMTEMKNDWLDRY